MEKEKRLFPAFHYLWPYILFCLTTSAMAASPNPLDSLLGNPWQGKVKESALHSSPPVGRSLLLSTAATALPIAAAFTVLSDNSPLSASAFLLGIGLGPSAGSWYLGEWASGWKGVGSRAGGIALMAVGSAVRTSETCTGGFSEGQSCSTLSPLGVVLVGSGSIVLASGIFYSFFQPFSLPMQKETHSLLPIELLPSLALNPDSRPSYGLTAMLHF